MSGDRPYRDLPLPDLFERSSLGEAAALGASAGPPPEVRKDLLARGTRPAAPGTDLAAPATYFYLSHAVGAGAAPDPEVRRFFTLLCSYVADWAADVADDEHVTGRAVRPGHLAGDWAAGGQDDPLACRIFVPLLSPAYFADGTCRERWERFRDGGDDQRRRRHPFGLPAVVPVLWEPIAGVARPAWAAAADPAPGDGYGDGGMRALLADSNPAAYRKVIFRLARRIHRRAASLTSTG